MGAEDGVEGDEAPRTLTLKFERGAERSCQASNKFDEVSAATPCEFSQFLPI